MPMPRFLTNARPFLLYFTALCAALPIGFISVAKVLLLLCTLVALVAGWIGRDQNTRATANTSTVVVLLALALAAASALWSTGSQAEASAAVVKHGKLILIPVLVYLIRSRREAQIAVAYFAGGQVFLLCSTWLLVAGVALPWAISRESQYSHAVFSSYLDQSVMTAVLGALCWHMRSWLPFRHRSLLALCIVLGALACVFLVFQGRTGYSVAIALTVTAIWWEIPKKFRLMGAVVFFVLLFSIFQSSSRLKAGVQEIGAGVEIFSKVGNVAASSTGTRLALWNRSMQSIMANPVLGSGAGSWGHELNRLEEANNSIAFAGFNGNTHQEFLLWGVEMGLAGILMLCGILFALYRDGRGFEPTVARAHKSLLVALIVACMFNAALFDALIGDYFCIGLGLFMALGLQRESHDHV